MTPRTRKLMLALGITFCVAFALMTLSVIARHGPDPFTLLSLAIDAMISTALWSAIKNPPPPGPR